MSRIEQTNVVSFKYFINLGNDRFGSMSINEKTNLYEEAERFCKQHNLSPRIAMVLENQMFQQILKIKQQMATKRVIFKPVGKILKNTNDQDKQDIQKPLENPEPRTRNTGSILHQHESLQKSRRSVPRKNSCSRHFEEMFRRHEQIENKKEQERKASLSKIPFKPVINSLSRKIVDLKRCAMSRNTSQKVYTIRIDRSKENAAPRRNESGRTKN